MFNQVIKKDLIDTLEECANGKSEVDMADMFSNTALQVISWVCKCYMYVCMYVCILVHIYAYEF